MRYSYLTQRIDSVWSDSLHGTDNADYFELTWGNDSAYGGRGNDVFWDVDGSTAGGNSIWLASNDRIYGEDGDDLIFAGLGADSIYGGSGFDTLDYRYSASGVSLNINNGTGSGSSTSAATGDRFSGIERFVGSHHADTFVVTDGEVAEGVIIEGGSGRDTFFGGTMYVELYGGSGNDIFRDTGFGTYAYGGTGDDLFVTPSYAARVYGGSGSDTLTFATAGSGVRLENYEHDGMERIIGSNHADLIETNAAAGTTVTVEGGLGQDSLTGGISNDWLYGGAERDELKGAAGNDYLFGGEGGDDLRGGPGDDWIRGGAGNDFLGGETGFDFQWGEDGDDRMSTGSEGMMMGGAGNDTIFLGGAKVTAYGEDGADVFVFGSSAAQQGRIEDFETGRDVLQIDAYVGRFLTRDTLRADGPNAFDVLVDGVEVGRISWRTVNGDTLVEVDRDLNGTTDYSVILNGTIALSAGDFLL